MYIYIIYTPYIAPWNFGENKRIKSNRHQNHQVLSLTSCSIRQLHLAALLEDRHHPTIIQFCKKKMYVTVAVYMVYANYPNPSQSYNVNSYPLVPPLVHLQRCAPPRDVYYDWLDHSTGTPGTLALPPGESRSTRAPRPRWMSPVLRRCGVLELRKYHKVLLILLDHIPWYAKSMSLFWVEPAFLQLNLSWWSNIPPKRNTFDERHVVDCMVTKLSSAHQCNSSLKLTTTSQPLLAHDRQIAILGMLLRAPSRAKAQLHMD